MNLNELPFHIGATESIGNPAGLPDEWPFSLHFDQKRGIITQRVTPSLLEILKQAYQTGQVIGTPLASDSYGKPYADDFLRFISQMGLPRGAKAVEIGAGAGYLTRRLKKAGFQIVGIEPGCGYAAHWKKNGVEIINDFFPTPLLTGSFSLICGYALLEHINEPAKFLQHVRDHLMPEGMAVFSVPDCTDEIVAGDPAILFHEHISYFDVGSLARLIESAGMHATVMKSGFGRCLYAIASLQKQSILQRELGLELKVLSSFSERCSQFVERVRGKISDLFRQGSVGVYCAARGLALLDRTECMRFFDDDPLQQGKFLPPFKSVITGRMSLLATPVDNLIVMSRTFGQRICDTLREQEYRGRIVTLNEM